MSVIMQLSSRHLSFFPTQEGRGGSRNSHDAGGVVMWRDLHSVVARCSKAEGWRGRRGECGGTTWRRGDLHGVVARCPKAAARRGVLTWRGETRRQDLRGLNGVARLRTCDMAPHLDLNGGCVHQPTFAHPVCAWTRRV